MACGYVASDDGSLSLRCANCLARALLSMRHVVVPLAPFHAGLGAVHARIDGGRGALRVRADGVDLERPDSPLTWVPDLAVS